MEELQCPRCGAKVNELQNIDPALATKLRESGNTAPLPGQVCLNCYQQVMSTAGKGSMILAREKQKEQRKLMLWKSRVNVIKKARQHMSDKRFSDAAVEYEKYLKVLEIVFEVKGGGLTPEAFKDSARTQELTIVAGVYWDLLRIYDTSEKYGERMRNAAEKLSQFLKFTPVYPDIMRKAEAFSKTAKNSAVIKSFLKSASDTKGKCFIATATFESSYSSEVIILQEWRDQVLLKSKVGMIFVKFYYFVSPTIAKLIDGFPAVRKPLRLLLRLFINRALGQ